MYIKRLLLCVLFFLSSAFFSSCTKDNVTSEEPVAATSKDESPDAPTPPEPEEITFNPERVYFDFDKYNVRPEFEKGLTELADFLKSNQIKLTIEGHCDERGTTEYNLGLGNRRANSVKQYIMALGVEDGRITTVSYGEERLLVDGASSDAHRQNRRAELNLSR